MEPLRNPGPASRSFPDAQSDGAEPLFRATAERHPEEPRVFARRLEGWNQNVLDGSRRAPDSAGALPSALLTMTEMKQALLRRSNYD